VVRLRGPKWREVAAELRLGAGGSSGGARTRAGERRRARHCLRMGEAERGRESEGNRGRVRGRLPEDARHGRVHDGERERGGGYGVVGEADEWSPLTGYRGSEGRVRARGWGWQAGPTDRGRAGAGLCGPDGPKVRGGKGFGLLCLFFLFPNF
jgi:hypothetical protein